MFLVIFGSFISNEYSQAENKYIRLIFRLFRELGYCDMFVIINNNSLVDSADKKTIGNYLSSI